MPRTARAVLLFTFATELGACGSDPTDASGTDATSAGETSTTDTGPSATAAAGPDDGASSATDPGSGPSATDSGAGDTTNAADDTTGDPPLPRDAIAVAVGYGTRRVRSEDGQSWTDFVEVNPDGGDDDDLLRGIGYGDGVFLAVGGAGLGFSMRSFDGVSWQDENHDPTAFVSDTVWQDGIFVAVGGNGLRMRSLDRGVSWQDATPYFAGHYRALAAGDAVVVAVGHTYGDTTVGLLSTTMDGATWTPEQTGGAGFSGGSIAFGHGVFVARDQAGLVRTSVDGTAWSDPTLELGDSGTMLFADGTFVTAGDTGYLTSTDGTRWTEIPARFPRDVAGFIDGAWLSLGWPATIDASADLETWQTVFAPGGSGLTDIAVGSPGR